MTKKVIFLTVSVLAFWVSGIYAQLSIGASYNIRDLDPGGGYAIYVDIGIPTESNWKLTMKGFMTFWGTSTAQYTEMENDPEYEGPPPYPQVEVIKDGQIDSFDRGFLFRIMYQRFALKPYMGFGLTYSNNDIIYPDEPPEFDLIDKALGKDLYLGFELKMGHLLPFFEMQKSYFSFSDHLIQDEFTSYNVGIAWEF